MNSLRAIVQPFKSLKTLMIIYINFIFASSIYKKFLILFLAARKKYDNKKIPQTKLTFIKTLAIVKDIKVLVPSSSGPGHRILIPVTRVRFPLGLPKQKRTFWVRFIFYVVLFIFFCF